MHDRKVGATIMQLAEFIEYMNFSHTLKATINKNTEVYAVWLLPEDESGIREDIIYLTTDCGRTERLIQTEQVKNLLCLCDPGYIKNVNQLYISAQTNVIFTDPADMTDLFLMRSRLAEQAFSDLNEKVRLLEKLIVSGSLEELSHEGTEYLGHEFLLLDSTQNVICSNFAQVETGNTVISLIAQTQPFKEQPGVECFNSPGRATYIKTYDYPDRKGSFLISQFTADGKVLGYLAVDYGTDPVAMEDYYRTSVMSSLSCKLILSVDRMRNPVNTLETLFMRLLEGNMTRNAAAKECAALKWRVPEKLRILVARTEDGRDYPAILQPALDALLSALPEARGFLYTNQIIIFFEDRALEDKFYRKLEDHKIYCAISRSFDEIAEARQLYRQTDQALKLAQKLSLPERSCRFEDMNLYFMLDNIGDPFKLKQMIHPGLFCLLEADREGNTALFDTFACYVSCIGNINLVAEKMFVHRNTVKYRITRIEELLGIDLRNPEEYHIFLLSFKIIEYLKRTKEW